ncbi:MAG: hypothetical protein R3362_05615 [Rhodothermales bacterium]|nr:hypothetical protein [Rhodothermales bacterium]
MPPQAPSTAKPEDPSGEARGPVRRGLPVSPAALAVEVGSIVLAVLLAFAVNAWWSGRATAERVEAVEATIADEVLRNRAVLDGRQPYHERMRDSVWAQWRRFDEGNRRLRPGEELPGLREMGFENGLATAATLRDAGWETALATDALTHMGVAQVRLLAEVYAQQEQVEETVARLAPALQAYRAARFEGERPAMNLFTFGASLTDLVLRQEEQIAFYDSLLAVLDVEVVEQE